MRGREVLAVLFHLDGAEQLRPQRRFGGRFGRGGTTVAKAVSEGEKESGKDHGLHLGVWYFFGFKRGAPIRCLTGRAVRRLGVWPTNAAVVALQAGPLFQ